MELNFTNDGLYSIQATEEELLSFVNLLQNKRNTLNIQQPTVVTGSTEKQIDSSLNKNKMQEKITIPAEIKISASKGRKPLGKVVNSVPFGYVMAPIILKELGLPTNYQASLVPSLLTYNCAHVTFCDNKYFSFEDAIRTILQNPQNTVAKEKVKEYLDNNKSPDYEKYHIPEGYFLLSKIIKRNKIKADPVGIRKHARNHNCSSVKINNYEYFKEDELLDILTNKITKKSKKFKNIEKNNVNGSCTKDVIEVPNGYYSALQFCKMLDLQDNYFATLHPFLKKHNCERICINNTFYYFGEQAFELMKKAREGSILKNAYNKKFGIESIKETSPTKTDFYHWKRTHYEKIQNAGYDVGKICSLVFKRMTDIYGINWDQVSRDFYRYNHRTPASRIESAYFLETDYKHGASGKERYENLFSVNLDHVLEDFKE